jgi:class 3 adenylate cyclase
MDFRDIKSSLDTTKLSNVVSRLFSKFDDLARIHGVQRIDVIESAYMAATNMMGEQLDDHAARLARFAMDAVAAARSTRLDEDDENSPCVAIRAGLHCGPLPTRPLCTHTFNQETNRPGKTVSMASLMESSSCAGRVQCSEAAAAMIARQCPDLELEARAGGVEVKMRRRLRTFWLRPWRPSPQASPVAGSAGRRLGRLLSQSFGGPDRCSPLASSGRRALSILSQPVGGGSFDSRLRHPCGEAREAAGIGRRLQSFFTGLYLSAPVLVRWKRVRGVSG